MQLPSRVRKRLAGAPFAFWYSLATRWHLGNAQMFEETHPHLFNSLLRKTPVGITRIASLPDPMLHGCSRTPLDKNRLPQSCAPI
jgi:hypothetical protein